MSELLGRSGSAADGQGPRTAGAETAPIERTDLRPYRMSGVVECDVRDELLVYQPASETVVSLNASGRAIWELCQAERTVGEIAEVLAGRLRVPADALLPDVLDAVGRLQSLGLLTLAGPSVAPPA